MRSVAVVHDGESLVQGGNAKTRKDESAKGECKVQNSTSDRIVGENDAFDYQFGSVEVEEQANFETRGLEVGLQLSEVNFFEGPYRLQLDHDLVFDDQVKPMRAHFLILEEYCDCALWIINNSAVPQSDLQSTLINGFEKSRAELSVNTDGRLNDLPRQRFKFMTHCFSFRVFALSCFRVLPDR